MKTWKSIITGKGQNYSSTAIKTEIEKLEVAGQELENGLPGLKRTMEKARQDLLSESAGASDRMKEAQGAISENENKKLGISGIIRDLNVALEKALTSETIKKQAEITRELAEINDKAEELRQEILKNFATTAVLCDQLMGNEREDHNLSYDFFQRCNLSSELRRQIDAGISEHEGLSLYTRREQLTRMSEQLSKKSIS